MEGCTAGLSQHEGKRGFGKKGLQAGVLGADPQNFAHVTSQGACRAVDELAHSAHTGFSMRRPIKKILFAPSGRRRRLEEDIHAPRSLHLAFFIKFDKIRSFWPLFKHWTLSAWVFRFLLLSGAGQRGSFLSKKELWCLARMTEHEAALRSFPGS